jgi:hypothetical protein
MQMNGTEVDAYGRPTEAARAQRRMKRLDPTASVKERLRLSGARPAYAIWGTKRGEAKRLSLYMPDEATAWINADYQPARPKTSLSDRSVPDSPVPSQDARIDAARIESN